MRLVRRFLTVVISLALGVTAVTWTLQTTLFDAAYVKDATERSGLYKAVADAVPTAIADRGGERVSGLVGSLVTPELVQSRLEGIIPGLINFWQHGGAVPRLDITEIAVGLRAAGVDVPEALATEPQAVTPDEANQTARTAALLTANFRWIAPGVTAAAGLLLFALSRRRLLGLAWASLMGAVVTAITAGISLLMPSIVTAPVATSPLAAFAPAIRLLADALAKGVSERLLWWAVVWGIVAIVIVLLHAGGDLLRRARRKRLRDEPADPEQYAPRTFTE